MFPELFHIVNSVAQKFTILRDWFENVNLYLYNHFGFWGQLAFCLVLIYFLLLILFKISKAAFDVVFYVIIPSLVLSFLTSFVLPFTFATVLPVCVALLIVVNVFRFV